MNKDELNTMLYLNSMINIFMLDKNWEKVDDYLLQFHTNFGNINYRDELNPHNDYVMQILVKVTNTNSKESYDVVFYKHLDESEKVAEKKYRKIYEAGKKKKLDFILQREQNDECFIVENNNQNDLPLNFASNLKTLTLNYLIFLKNNINVKKTYILTPKIKGSKIDELKYLAYKKLDGYYEMFTNTKICDVDGSDRLLDMDWFMNLGKTELYKWDIEKLDLSYFNENNIELNKFTNSYSNMIEKTLKKVL